MPQQMSPRVFALLLLRRKRFAAHGAQMSLSKVHVFVLLHGLAASKTTSTLFTTVWLLSRMNADVLNQLERAAQHLSTNLADKRRSAADWLVVPLLQNSVLADMLCQLKTL